MVPCDYGILGGRVWLWRPKRRRARAAELTAKAEHGGCPYNRRPPHAHYFVRGICNRCGARDEQAVDETPWRELDAARKEFRKAAQALDEQMATTPLGAPEILRSVIDFRSRIEFLRRAETAWNEKYPQS